MISFMVCIGKIGIIKEIEWSEPAYIIPDINDSFSGLFADSERVLLLALIEECKEKEFCVHELPLALKNHLEKVKLYTLSMDEDILILGIDERFAVSSEAKSSVYEIIRKFMELAGENFKLKDIINMETVRSQFEKIQMLNNKLINTQRMLEKTNAKLNLANTDLNNRLVKDALTGLVSRYQYRTEIECFIKKYSGKLGIFTFIDIDNFKSVNDNYSHAVGDLYLIEFAQRLKSLSLENTVKIRIAGDEFGLFTFGLDVVNSEIIKNIWEELKNHVLGKTIDIDGVELSVSISAGMAVYGRDTFNIYELIDYADFAMYQAKRTDKNNYRIFDKVIFEEQKGIR